MADLDLLDEEDDPLLRYARSLPDEGDPLVHAPFGASPERRQLIPSPAEQKPGFFGSLGETELTDYPKAIGAGVTSLAREVGQGAAALPVPGVAPLFHSPALRRVSLGITGEDPGPGQGDVLLAKAGTALHESMSPGAKQASARQYVRRDAEGDLELGDATAATIALDVAESLPAVGAGIIGGAGSTRVLTKVADRYWRRAGLERLAQSGNAKATARLQRIDRVLAAAGYGIGEASVAAPLAAQSVRDEVMALEVGDLMASSRFREIYEAAQELAPLERLAYARETLANELAETARLQVGIATLATGPLGAGVASRATRLLAGKGASRAAAAPRGRLTEAGVSGAQEATQEFVQSGAEGLLTGRQVQIADPSVDPVLRAANEAVGGAAAGGVIGASLGAATGRGQAAQAPSAAVAAPAPDSAAPAAVQPTAADITKLAKRARELGVEHASLREISQGVLRKRITRAEAAEQLNAMITGAEPATAIPKAPDGAPAEPTRAPDVAAAPAAPAEEPAAPETVAPQTEPVTVQQRTEDAGATIPPAAAIDTAAHEAATSPKNDLPEPTPAQIESGNYKKGHVRLHGLEISIENPKGSERSGVDRAGKKWKAKLAAHYGYIRGTVGKDKDHIDIFLGPQAEDARHTVYVVDQPRIDSDAFDEHKVLMGFATRTEAERAYRESYNDDVGAQLLERGRITPLKMPQFMEWLEKGDHTKRAADWKIDRTAAPQPPVSAVSPTRRPKYTQKSADAKTDSALEFLAKAGGVSITETESEGLDPADLKSHLVGIRRAFHRNGMTLESAGERLAQAGFDVLENGRVDKNKVVDLIEREVRGRKQYSSARAEEALDRQLFEREASERERIAIETDAAEVHEFTQSDEPTRDWAVLRAHAIEAGVTEEELEGALDVADDMAAEANVRALIARKRDEASRGTETRPEADAARGVGEGARGVEAPGEQAPRAPQTKESPAEPASEIRRPDVQTDLLGEDTRAAQALADETRRRDEKRSPQKDVPLEIGEATDLFSQARQQIDIEDRAPPVRGDAEIKAHVDDVEARIADGESNAEMIPWPEGKDAPAAIARYEKELEARGWERFTRGKGEFLRKGSAELFVRSQGELSSPIVQWSVAKRIEKPASAPERPEPPPTEPLTLPPAKATEKPAAAITDVGAELWYNRRNRVGRGIAWDDVKDLNPTLRTKEVTKSKVWPRPDYAALIEDGLQPFFAHLVKHVYDSIALAPDVRGQPTDEDLQLYIDTVHRVREAVFSWVRNKDAQKALLDRLMKVGSFSAYGGPFTDLMGSRTALLDLIFPGETGQQRFASGTDNARGIRIIGGKKPLEALQPGFDEARRAIKAVDGGWPAAQEAWQKQGYHVLERDKAVSVRPTSGGKFMIEVDRRYHGVFETEEAARTTVAGWKPWLLVDKRSRLVASADTEAAAIEVARERTRKGGKESITDRRLAIADAVREGPPRRAADEDVLAERLMETFGFRGVNFGNWTNQVERQASLNAAFDAMHDLAEILNVPLKSLSLNGMLGIAFGAQGTGKAAAHFVPGVNEINLTKTAGAGALAHEWGHALDHYFATQAGFGRTPDPFLTHHAGRAAEGATIRPEISEAFKLLMDRISRRPLTVSEMEQRRAQSTERALKGLERFIAPYRQALEREGKGTEDEKQHAIKEFDALAERLRRGEYLGAGYTKVGRLDMPQVIAQIRLLLRDRIGPAFNDVASLWKDFANQAAWVSGALKAKEADQQHDAQRVATTMTDYRSRAGAIDAKKGGKTYWARETELFARAFETYVLDKLEAQVRRNTYLTSPIGITPEQRAAVYPQGEERIAINAAIDGLVKAIETRETDEGIAMFSIRDDTAGATASGVPAEVVRGWVKPVADELAGLVDVEVVADIAALREAAADPEIPEDVQGLYFAGSRRVYLVASQLPIEEVALAKARHELGHFAMERHPAIERAVRHTLQLRKMGSKSVNALWSEVTRTQPGLSEARHAREVLALMAERGVKNTLVDQLITAAREILRRFGLKVAASEAEIRQFIVRALRAAREEAQQLAARDEAAAGRADAAFRRGDDEALGAALSSMSIARAAARGILAKEEVEDRDQAEVDDATAELLVDAPEDQQALFSRRGTAPEDAEITEIRRRVMANAAHEGLPLKDRVRLILQRLTGLSGLALKQGLIDSFAAISAYERLLNEGELLDASASPYKQTVATQNLPSVMTAILHTGVPIWRDGAYVRADDGRKGLLDIFAPLVNHAAGNLLPQWELYAAARRASRLIQETNRDGSAREKLFTQVEIDRTLKLEKAHPEFATVFDEWQVFNAQVLDMAQEAGLIDPVARTIWERNDYVPFYRAIEEISGRVNQVSLRKAIANQRAKIRTLHGSERALSDVFESMLMNTAHLVDASFKNRAAQAIVTMFDGVATSQAMLDPRAVQIDVPQVRRALENADIHLSENLSPEQKAQWLTFFKMMKPAGSNIVTVMFEGKPRYFEVHDPLLYQSITQMHPNDSLRWLDLLGFTAAKRLLTRAATAVPAFIVRNWLRDTMSAWAQNHVGLKPFIDSTAGFYAYLRDKPLVRDLMLAGAGGDAVYDNQPGNIKKILLRQMSDSEGNVFLRTVVSPRRIWKVYTQLQQASENANRIAVYKAVRARGGTHAEAAYQAHDVLNFQQHGAWAGIQFFTRVVPFLNARIQGLDRLTRGFKENHRAFMLKGLMLTAATLLLMAVGDDDERYQELEDWERDAYWHLFVGGAHFRLPKPFELGAVFGTIPERAIRLLRGQDQGRETWRSMSRLILDTFAFNPIPQLFKPAIEDAANYDFFRGRPIVGQFDEEKVPELQAKAWTSPTLVELAYAMPDWVPDTLRSPLRLEHWIRGYTAAMGIYVISAADALTRAIGGYPDAPSQPWYEHLPAQLATSSAPRGTKWTEELYRMAQEANSAAQAVRELRLAGQDERAREIAQRERPKLLARRRLNALVKQMRVLNKRSRNIQAARGLSAEAKREQLERINARRAEIARQVAPYAEVF